MLFVTISRELPWNAQKGIRIATNVTAGLAKRAGGKCGLVLVSGGPGPPGRCSEGAKLERGALGLWKVQHRAPAKERIARARREGGELVDADDQLD